MLNSSSSIGVTTPKSVGKGAPRSLIYNGAAPLARPTLLGDGENTGVMRSGQSVGISFTTVDIAPRQALTRRGIQWHCTDRYEAISRQLKSSDSGWTILDRVVVERRMANANANEIRLFVPLKAPDLTRWTGDILFDRVRLPGGGKIAPKHIQLA